MRILCKLFGCEPELNPCCKRCGEDLYNGDFIQIGWLDPWYRFVWWAHRNKDRVFRRCEECNKPMWFSDEICCSQKCKDDWIPF